MVTDLRRLLPEATQVDHIGSTSVPGLAAKDCIDLMVQVPSLDASDVRARLAKAGHRLRPEPWNREETSFGVTYRKQVFAPRVGARPSNLHVREQHGLNVRYALLFRDYLRADDTAARAWGRFKTRLAESVHDLADYGQIKAPAQELLIQAAERWAGEVGWQLAALEEPLAAAADADSDSAEEQPEADEVAEDDHQRAERRRG